MALTFNVNQHFDGNFARNRLDMVASSGGHKPIGKFDVKCRWIQNLGFCNASYHCNNLRLNEGVGIVPAFCAWFGIVFRKGVETLHTFNLKCLVALGIYDTWRNGLKSASLSNQGDDKVWHPLLHQANVSGSQHRYIYIYISDVGDVAVLQTTEAKAPLAAGVWGGLMHRKKHKLNLPNGS